MTLINPGLMTLVNDIRWRRELRKGGMSTGVNRLIAIGGGYVGRR